MKKKLSKKIGLLCHIFCYNLVKKPLSQDWFSPFFVNFLD